MILETKNLSGGYRKNHDTIRDINFSIRTNEIVGILGQNGAGKSTFAKAIIQSLPYIRGNVFYSDYELNQYNTHSLIHLGIGYYPQGGQIFPHLTIKENLLIAGLYLKKSEFRNRLHKLKEYFEILNGTYLNTKTKASYLSGGEKSQLSMAMVMLNSPKLLILDEPSAGLEPVAANKIYQALHKAIAYENLTIILIEQNLNRALDFCTRLVIMKNGSVHKILTNENKNNNTQIKNIMFN